MSEAEKRSRIASWVVPVVLGLAGGGGGTAVVNYALFERVAAAEVRIQTLEENKRDTSLLLKDLSMDVKEGNRYLRDEIAKAIARLETSVAVLEERVK